MKILDRFFEATECSPITIILAVGIVLLLWVVGKLWFRNTSLVNHIIEADKNNAVLATELVSNLDKIYKADEVNAKGIIDKINNSTKEIILSLPKK